MDMKKPYKILLLPRSLIGEDVGLAWGWLGVAWLGGWLGLAGAGLVTAL